MARSFSVPTTTGPVSFPTDGPAALTALPAAQVSVLDNGLRVVSEFRPSSSVSISVAVSTGSRYEPEAKNGLAHFCEHMFFKGTSNRTRVQLEKEVEDLGGELNAHTSREETVFTYTVRCLLFANSRAAHHHRRLSTRMHRRLSIC